MDIDLKAADIFYRTVRRLCLRKSVVSSVQHAHEYPVQCVEVHQQQWMRSPRSYRWLVKEMKII